MLDQKTDEKKRAKPRFRLFYALGWTVALFVVLDVLLRLLFAQPGLMVRNEGLTAQAYDYLFGQMEKSRAKVRVAWMGASVMQGLKNVDRYNTYPLLIGKALRENGLDVDSFNFAMAGNNLGDFYALTIEAAKHGANVVPVALHYKGFTKGNKLGSPMRYGSNAYYARGIDDFFKVRSNEFKVKNSEWQEAWLDQTLGRIWKLYNNRNMLFVLASNSDQTPMEYFSFHYKILFGFGLAGIVESGAMTYESRNQDNLWDQLPAPLMITNFQLFKNVDISEGRVQWSILDRLCMEANANNIVLLFYFAPINKSAIAKLKFFEWQKFKQWKLRAATHILQSGHMIEDMSDKVDNRYFTDFDHLNTNGHAQMAEVFAPYLENAIAKYQERHP